MTIAKIITCKVAKDQKAHFCHSQQGWKSAATCDGFMGQFGGWVQDEENVNHSELTAVIVGLWRTEQDLALFMATVHDDIIEQNQQVSTYLNCSVNRLSHVMPIHHDQDKFPNTGILRIAYCDDVTDKQAFMANQQHIWNPGMIRQTGFIGGDVWQNSTQHVVLSYWSSALAHQQYQQGDFVSLRQQAKPLSYIGHISGFTVLLEPLWRISEPQS
ncbi:DUF4937 domain-containing protein [Shewanella donghaensis]|uniref:DUF4937 domain-containing protein n=1 Tax=Shewanella donghaensis TaxID=238836 RepID=UPI001181FD11|nr:DUF4937 domain-containing protein [Shewanella donghaensis]